MNWIFQVHGCFDQIGVANVKSKFQSKFASHDLAVMIALVLATILYMYIIVL